MLGRFACDKTKIIHAIEDSYLFIVDVDVDVAVAAIKLMIQYYLYCVVCIYFGFVYIYIDECISKVLHFNCLKVNIN